MTDLIEFRRQQRVKRQLEELTERLDANVRHVEELTKRLEEQGASVSQLENSFKAHADESLRFATKKELRAVEEKSATKTQLKAVEAKAATKKQLKAVEERMPKPYDIEQLKKDHPTLKEPYLHEPKKHTHLITEIFGKIRPEQIEPQGHLSGLDADKVDGKHAKDLIGEVAKKVKKVYVGGGPHASTHEAGGADKVHFADLEHDEEDATLHDDYTGTPHISQAEKDKIHDRLHALSSTSDHTGEITDAQHGLRGSGLHADSHARQHALSSADDHTGEITDAQHGSRGAGLHADSHALDHRGRQLLQSGLEADRPAAGLAGRIYYSTETKIFWFDDGTKWVEYLRAETACRLAQLAEKSHASLTGVTADQHHPKLHASSHEKGGDDVLGVVVAFKFGAEGATTTSTTYVTIADSDIAFNPALFKLKDKLYVKFIYHIKNDTSGQTTYIQVYRQNAGTAVAGSEKSAAGPNWSIVETGWIDWSSESGLESYQLQMKVTGGTGEFNSALMILSAVQL